MTDERKPRSVAGINTAPTVERNVARLGRLAQSLDKAKARGNAAKVAEVEAEIARIKAELTELRAAIDGAI